MPKKRSASVRSQKRSVSVRSLGDGKYDVSAGAENGLAVHDRRRRWMLSPNLRGLPGDTMDALLKRLDEVAPTPEPSES